MFKPISMALALCAGPAFATDISQPSLEDLLWVARPVVVFTDTPNDPRLAQQLEMLAEEEAEMEDRDVVILTDVGTDMKSDLRVALRPRGFTFVLIGKDGEVKYRKPRPVTARELERVIDKMPMRRQEIELRKEAR